MKHRVDSYDRSTSPVEHSNRHIDNSILWRSDYRNAAIFGKRADRGREPESCRVEYNIRTILEEVAGKFGQAAPLFKQNRLHVNRHELLRLFFVADGTEHIRAAESRKTHGCSAH